MFHEIERKLKEEKILFIDAVGNAAKAIMCK
jgi:hypothetical protein